ncbi:type I restriction endonuclease subunit R [Vaginisenegalia massiliensis]|uniref:type I restriction endonuclease subunit R n=1 Tax=Vaginisenegalia massiliensis TaxID=2058294 RepID=UPI000F52D6D9|nr:HsdR family type I site-specific deoxyribonuclease [Vaginisenegalia massiliensis]
MKKISYLDEAAVERELIRVLGEGHNQWTYRDDLKSEADLWQNLRNKICQNNVSEIGEHPLTDVEFEKIKAELLSRTQTPFDAAKWLKGENGIARISIEREDIRLGSMSLILFSNCDVAGGISSYEVVNQIATKKSRESARDRRFDVTLLINGLPIVQIELKQVTAKDGVFQAFNQIKKYAEEGLFRNNIFSTLQLFVVSNEQTTRYFANALPKNMHEKFLFSWRTKDNKKIDNLYEFCKQALTIPEAHRLISLYTIVSDDHYNKVLMVLHPYQIHAIEALYVAANKHQSGYVWHATGSGKTLTSFVSTKLLARKTGIDRTIMLVDRKDLDNQTTSEFTKFASEFNTGLTSGNSKENSLIVGTGSAQELSKALLADANSNVVIVTTRQKLDAALKYARKQEEASGKNRYEKLMGQHIVFIVDECHRALSAENMNEIKAFFPNSTWFGFTGTPIFEENKKQAKGQLARTTFDQYGPVLHTYTIKNALEDGAVLGFQVEHEDTIEKTSLDNRIYSEFKIDEKYASYTDDAINQKIDEMDPIEKEERIGSYVYEQDEHIYDVIKKILRPDNAYMKFDFKEGKPTKSAILTTSSIDMAKRYYHAIKEFTSDPDWLVKQFPDQAIRQGRTMNDPDFPRIAITYSLEENANNAAEQQAEMQKIIDDYNEYYQTSWSIAEMNRYNGDINNRLARKKAEFQKFGNHIDLVIVVDRLLTGFDAPTIQTLFVDRNLEYAGLIQAFSRTNRTYPGKKKGLIVTFRKPATMEQNVANATRLYSETKEDSGLIYPTYEASKKQFRQTYKNFHSFLLEHIDVDEHSPLEQRIDYMKNYQQFVKAYEAVITYDEFNDEIQLSKEVQRQVKLIETNQGQYETIKASVIVEIGPDVPPVKLLAEIEFFSGSSVKLYDIDSAFIDQLLGDYSANNTSARKEIEDALQKLNKVEIVKSVYRRILNSYDEGEISEDESVFSVKRRFFYVKKEEFINDFAKQWFASVKELHTSALQYISGMDDLPNLDRILDSLDFKSYQQQKQGANPFVYQQEAKKAWRTLLEDSLVPLENELR